MTLCPAVIAPATSASVSFTCSPDTVGAKVASLDLTTNDEDEGSVSYVLECDGAVPEFVSAPAGASNFDFGTVIAETTRFLS